MNQKDMEHLGDGVYAGHDGYQIWLTVNDHRNAELVAMDANVLQALNQYAKRIGILPTTA